MRLADYGRLASPNGHCSLFGSNRTHSNRLSLIFRAVENITAVIVLGAIDYICVNWLSTVFVLHDLERGR